MGVNTEERSLAMADSLPARMKDNQYFKVPRAAGCVGEPRVTIWKPKILRDEWMLNSRGFRYVVGPDLELNDAVIYMLRGKATHKTKHVHGHHTVRFFKHYRSAVAYFNEKWSERIEFNRRVEADRQYHRSKVNSENPADQVEGALGLLDH